MTKKSALIGSGRCKFPPFYNVLTNRRTDQPNDEHGKVSLPIIWPLVVKFFQLFPKYLLSHTLPPYSRPLYSHNCSMVTTQTNSSPDNKIFVQIEMF